MSTTIEARQIRSWRNIVEILSAGFLSALLAIVVIDLVLAGDNAIVIALAARNVPKHLQKRAILWGTAGAIVMRVTTTMLVVWLLRIPGLLAIGGALLIFIAYRLLIPEDHHGDDGKTHSASSFWGAMRTIIVADTVMGLDNVLAVAGASHGSFLLVAIGLLISIPIVVWGSTLILGFVERFPAFVYFGAGVLAWTSAKMITHEPLLSEMLQSNGLIVPVIYLVIVGGVLWAGFRRNHLHLESRIRARLAQFASLREENQANRKSSVNGETAMLKVLVPVDASTNSLKAVQQVAKDFARNTDMEIHLLHIQSPLTRHAARFVSKRNLDDYHHTEAEKALKPARAILDRQGVPYSEHVEKGGQRAELIVAAAKRLRCDEIVMGTARKNSLTRMLESSTTNRVLEMTPIPVEIVSGDDVSKLERYGLPAGLATAVAFLWLVAD
jgi:YjbE family integral membrane protein